VVDAIVVIEAQVGVELSFQPGVARVDVAGEGGSSALLEDRLVERLDVAIRLWSAGMDSTVAGLELLQCGREVAAELVAVIGEHPLQPPAGGLQLPCDPLGELAGLSSGGVPCLQITSSTHAYEEAMSIAVSCQIAPSVPFSRPT
jgi:hypothetical protein